MSRTFASTRLTSAPTTTARTRRGVAGSSAATATTTSSSSGSRTNAPRVRSAGWFGATSAAHTNSRARTVIGTAGGRTSRSRRRHSHHVHSPTDAASEASAATRSACVSDRGRTSAAATVSTTPCAAATTLRQRRRGSGATHPRQEPLAGEEHVARRPDGEHPRTVDRGDVDAEGEDQERVDLAVEARTQRGRGPGAPRHPAVGQVECERRRRRA